MDFDAKVDLYLKECFGPGAKLTGMERRGKGTHGTGYLLKFTLPGEERELIMKSLSPSGFGHDHYSDRAQVLLLAQSNYNEMDKHVQALDVVGDSPDRLISLREAREFYIFMQRAAGIDYFKDLDAVLEQGRLYGRDRERAQSLARFIAKVHQNKYAGDEAKTLYRRRIRDLLGHIFTETYADETRDYGFFDVAAPFFAFRVLVIAHPKFYPHDGPEIKRRLLNFGLSVLEDDAFHMDRINDYLKH